MKSSVEDGRMQGKSTYNNVLCIGNELVGIKICSLPIFAEDSLIRSRQIAKAYTCMQAVAIGVQSG